MHVYSTLLTGSTAFPLLGKVSGEPTVCVSVSSGIRLLSILSIISIISLIGGAG